MAKRLFSGIQSTGNFHIGNYLGALRNWVELQDDYEAIYCVVDWHSMTVPYEPADLAASRLRAAKELLALGVDPSRSLLYLQSEVLQHAELTWILGTLTSMGALSRMTQYKEKSQSGGQFLGLFAYPVLMAADILIHHVHAVPVGDDQSQHLELTRDVAQRFNHRFGEEFPIPETIIPKVGARVMSLKDPLAKMAKSDPDPGSRIELQDSADLIVKKFKSAVTDSGAEVRLDRVDKPGISNLLDILSRFTGSSLDDLVSEYGDSQYGSFKLVVAEAVAEGLAPIRAAFDALDDGDVRVILDAGAARAREMAEESMASVRNRVGLR